MFQVPEGYVLVPKEQWEAVLKELAELRAEVKELRARLNQNSNNSSKPPSSDGFKRNRSLRTKSGKKSGGQPGHSGNRLEMVSTPDKIIRLEAGFCPECGGALGRKVQKVISRQVFDIPEQKSEVTEFQSFVHRCACCRIDVSAEFPKDVNQQTQYGPKLKALIVYLSCYQMLPLKRLCEQIENQYGLRISQGMVMNTLKECMENLSPFNQKVYNLLARSQVVGFDETGIYAEKKLFWLHTASTPKLTLFFLHPKRGCKAMNEFGLLPQFKGTAIHDRWASYQKYECEHGLCNSHLLRELKYLSEEHGYKWATELKHLLQKAKKLSDNKSILKEKQIRKIEIRFGQIVSWGLRQCAKEGNHVIRTGSRGRNKQSKSKNLLDDLKAYQNEFLKFLRNPLVPFDNNQSERDIRMSKVKLKISGCFRSFKGAQIFSVIRAYINTAVKNEVSVIDALKEALLKRPFLPKLAE
jgi:transposase